MRSKFLAVIFVINILIGLFLPITLVMLTSGWSIGSISFLIIMYGTLGIIYWKFIRPRIQNRKILKTGQLAEATILKIWDTGETYNDAPKVGFMLQVRPVTGILYKAKVEQFISRLSISAYQPGAIVSVRIDHNDNSKVAIEGIKSGASSGATIHASPEEIQKLIIETNTFNVNLMANGERAEAKILKYSETGININGNNPFIEFLLEVHPVKGPKFQATAKGPILATSVQKYQAGKMVFVRFDPNDLTKVTIDPS
jgi:hypothetical protein